MSPAEPDDDGPARAGDPARGAAAFEEIVAGWRAEGAVPAWPDERRAPGLPAHPEPVCSDQPGPGPRAAEHPDPDEGHFVPPEPPPLPRIGRSAAVGFTLLAAGLLLLVTPEVLGIAESAGLTVGLLTLATGLGWLVLRTWSSDPPEGDGDGEDDGAVL